METESRTRRASKRVPWIEFAIALSVLLAVAIASDTVTDRLASAQYWLVHAHEVETAIEQARADMVSAVDSRQVFIITGDRSALDTYEHARQSLPAELSQLQKMTIDNPTQQATITNLRQVVTKRLALLQQSIDLREETGSDQEEQKRFTEEGMDIENQALTIFAQMKAEEDRLMAVRQTISTRTYERVRIILLISFGVVVALLTINFYDLSHELRERRMAEESVMQLSGRILRIQDVERRRVARELHDTIGQTFSLLKMNLEMMARTLTETEPERIRQLLAESTEALDSGLSGARTLSHILHPPLLDEMGLECAAKWLADGFSKRSNIQVKLEVPDDLPRMADDVELTLFRILQEGLTNVHKHSGSSSVEIDIDIDGLRSVARLRMRDFGHGIPQHVIETFNKSQPGLGVGLAGMRERVRDLGGHLELKSDGSGAIIEATIPFVPIKNDGDISGAGAASSC